ncbi:RNA polymerase I-specific transcription initiation factor RRN3-like [Cucurbita maxima]|uniref:RNA polymerase I-specific transcription initiation factor RRN3-like n=1 Tax=Cucurbita maxima TaxID=3661 RepID=A0A6J1IFT9_CUCMA|nr:RNA polymerase I-specific transcription initiation factor RRN3-like [Cucurbita maxima]XP_022973840.1 RNA polymerase I-specific transcription initiation factor RRN3-like [Cucurbita maxima]
MGVEFENGQAQFQDMEGVNFTDDQLVDFIRGFLTSVSLGNTDGYHQLVGVIHHRDRLSADEVALLVTCLKALSGAVSCIDVVLHESLLAAIFKMSLWDYGPNVMDALIELITSLAVSSGKYVDSCLDMLVTNFMPPHSYKDFLKKPHGLTRKDEVLSRVHTALKDISDLVPLAPLRLELIVVHKMQRVFFKESLTTIYVENMLRLEKGAMSEFVGRKILTALVDKLLDLDVEIGWDDILQDDFSKGIFEIELEDDNESTDDIDEDSSELPRELSRKSLGGNVIAETLDSLIVLTFEHLESCERDGRLNEVFDILLLSFQRTVLTAYKSKFAQFVIFYACALDLEVCGARFAVTLADMFISRNGLPLTRMSAISYLASYLSRGKFLSTSLVTTILKRLVDWCLEYGKTHDVDLNPKAHKIFYSGCQAIMYVLCFRMRSILEIPRLKSQLLLMPIGRILTHRLSPLKVCLPSIVEEFLRQAKVANLFTPSETFIFNGLLESEYSKTFGGIERLDMFFPYDPCLLKRCDRYLRPYFVYWSMVRPTYDEEEEDEGSSDEDVAEVFPDKIEENLMDDEAMARSYDDREFDLDEFDNALDKMSITPRNSLPLRQDCVRMPSRIRPSMSPESL